MENQPELKRSLILAGGGVRLAYHAGVLKALEEEGLSFNHIDGTSGGIFCTAMMASGISPKEAAHRWRNLNLKGFMGALPIKNYFSRHNLAAMGSSQGIRKKIFPALGIRIEKINTNTGFDSTFNVCNFSNKTIEAIPHTSVTEDHLIAGMSLPIFMPAVKINNDWYTDAVWIKDANLTEAINRGAEDIWLVWCIGNNREYLNGSLNQYVHMIEMSASGGLFTEIELLQRTNLQRMDDGLKPISLHIIKPEYPLPLDPDFLLNRVNADTLINMGYADARHFLLTKLPFDMNLPPSHTTAMKEPGITVHFRQHFNGVILFNEQNLETCIRLSFFLREINKRVIIQLYSSISFDNENFISGYQNQMIIRETGLIQPEFIFIFNKQEYHIRLEIQLSNLTDFLMGLNFKKAKVYFTANGNESKPYLFFQSALSRIKNAFYLYTKSESGWFEKRRAKLRILKTLFKTH